MKMKKTVNTIKKFIKKSSKTINPKKLKRVGVFLLIFLAIYFGRSLIFAAWVGNKPVFRFSLIKELEKQGGKSVLDSLIEKSLISQEASKAKVVISDDIVNLELSNIEGIVKQQGLTLDEALSARGQTRKDLFSQVKLQKTIEQILKDKIVVTDEEIKEYYDTNKMKEVFETVKDGIKDTLIQNKLQSEYSKWITGLKEQAKIFYFVKY
ncbi:MAG: hypothetical protein Q8P10_02510 [bacterium]|nr:hypothetical protein [bacterium]